MASKTAMEKQAVKEESMDEAAAPGSQWVTGEESGHLGGGVGPRDKSLGDKAPSMESVALAQESASKTTRKIITSGDVSIEVKSVEKAREKIEKIQEQAGGFVSSSSVEDQGRGSKSASVTIRMPAEKFRSVLKKIKKLGKVRDENTEADDVTEEYVDIQARLKNLKREESRFVEILQKANTVEDILKVESELGRVRGEIEVIEGRLRYLNDRISLSTLEISLYEPGAMPTPEKWNVSDTAKNAIRAFMYTLQSIVSFLIWLGVYSPLIILIILIIVFIRRRRKRRLNQG